MAHTCHAIGCQVLVVPKLLMCAHHWSLVEERLKSSVWKHYQPGQERTKETTHAYRQAAARAVIAVADIEGKAVAGFWYDMAHNKGEHS